MKIYLTIILLLFLTPRLFNQPSKWEWVNPYPTGSLINQCYFLNELIGFAVGASGTLVHTSDGGVTWEQINLGVNSDINFISFSDNLNGRLLGNDLNNITPHFFRTTDGGNTWIPSIISSFQVQLTDMFFVNSQIGWCIGSDGKIFKTTDGGINWMDKSLPGGTGINFRNIRFRDELNGYLFGIYYFQYPFTFCIANTADGGDNWNFIYGPVVSETFDSEILDDSTTVIACNNGFILRSADYCTSWTFKMGYPVDPYSGVDFLDSHNGIVSADSGFIMKTSDGGKNWNKLTTGFQSVFNSIQYLSENFMSASGTLQNSNNVSYILTSTDQGNSWINHTRFIENQLDLTSLYPVDPSVTYITGSSNYYDGYIYKTNDGGMSWQQSFYLPSYFINDIKALNNSVIFAGGGNYTQSLILKSTDNGGTWETKTFSGNVIKGLSLTDSTALYAFSESCIYKSSNMGSTWDIICQPSNALFRDMEFVSNLTGYCSEGYYPANIYKTTDGGNSWNIYSLSSSSEALKISFPSENVGYSIDWNNIFKTTDGGISWLQLPSPGYSYTDVAFNDEINGWIISYDGIYSTTDGGQTWNFEFANSYGNINLFGLNRDNSLWCFGENCSILKYTETLPNAVYPENDENIPRTFKLLQNYPNPFNPVTKIRYDIPRETHIVLKIYDVLGAEVATLVNDILKPGRYTAEWNAGRFASGVYIYRIESSEFTDVKKMMLVK